MPAEIQDATAGALPADATKQPGSVGQEEVTPKDPQSEGGEQDPSGGDAGAGEGGEGEGGGDAGGGEPKPKLTAEQRAVFGLTKRVGRLTNERAALKAENDQLRRQLGAAGDGGQAETGDDGEGDPPANGGDKAPPQLSEKEVERRARALAAQQVEYQRITGVVNKTITEGRKAFQDFDALTAAVDDVIGGFADTEGRMRPITAAIFDSEKPHELIKHLAENPEEADELAALPPIRQVRRIAQIEIELGKAKPKASSAPKPIVPARGSGVVQKDQSKMSDKEWFEEQRKRSG
jgi:hypothetical protein